MKIVVNFKELKKIKESINAEETSWSLGDNSLSDLELYEGKEISSLDDVKNYNGLLTYKGKQIILYIKDSRQSEEKITNPKDAPKFHIANCKTLDKMRDKNRIERYVTTTRATGIFLVDAKNFETNEIILDLELRLYVCKNCLTELEWNGYDPNKSKEVRDAITKEFSILDFLATYSTFFKTKPSQSDITAKTGSYVKNWQDISNRYKTRMDWKCERCKVNLKKKKEYLHCHHKNGVIQNNKSSNLEALCFLCHADMPYHGQLKAILKKQPNIKEEIEKLRTFSLN